MITKKKISDALKALEKNPNFKVYNFSSNKALRLGMKNFVDYFIIGKNAIWFIELKIGKNKLSDGQSDTGLRLSALKTKSKHTIWYQVITEKNYLEFRDYLLEIG